MSKVVERGLNPESNTEYAQEVMSDMYSNSLFNSFKTGATDVFKATLNQDTFIKAAKKADDICREHPAVLDTFAIKFRPDGRDGDITTKYNKENLIHRLIYYRANPWRFAYEVISTSTLNKTTPAGTIFRHFIPAQKLFLRDILDPREPKIIASCNRGGSKTWLCGLAISVATVVMPKIKITILGGSKDQSINLYNYFKIFMENSELKHLTDGDILATLTRFKHGGYVRALPASEKSVRGPRPDMLFLDETCEAESRVIKSALPQVLTASKLKIVATSTPHKMVHLFRDWWIYPEYGFKKHHWNAYDCHWIPKANIEEMKKVYTKEEFKIEVLGEFAPVTGSVFDPDTIHNATTFTDLPETTLNNAEWYPLFKDGEEVPLIRVLNIYGLDWGFEHPTVLTGGFLGNDGHAYVNMDIEMKRWRDQDIINRVVEEVRGNIGDVYSDSSHIFQNNNLRERLAAELNTTCTPLVYRAIKMRMVGNARRWLESGKVHLIKDDCHKLITELYNYSYAEGTDKPEKGNDDHVDSFLNIMWPLRGYLGTGMAGLDGRIANMAEILEENGGDVRRNAYRRVQPWWAMR